MRKIKWISLYRIANILVAMFLLTQLFVSNFSFTKIDYILAAYLCCCAAVENMYKQGMLAGILVFFKRKQTER